MAYTAALGQQDTAADAPPPPAAADQTSTSSSSSSSSSAAGPARHLPQLLVTRSEKLCGKLDKEISTILSVGSAQTAAATAAPLSSEDLQGPKLVDAAANITLTERAALPGAFAGVTDAHYPLVLPMRQLLDMLNASLAQPFTAGALRDSSEKGSSRHAAAEAEGDSSDSSDTSDSEDEASEVFAAGAAHVAGNQRAVGSVFARQLHCSAAQHYAAWRPCKPSSSSSSRRCRA
jgi:hypothetical protein